MRRLPYLRVLVSCLLFALFLTIAFQPGLGWDAANGAQSAWAAPVSDAPNQSIPLPPILLMPYVVAPPIVPCTFFEELCNLTNTEDAVESEYAWSPNGEQIAFVRFLDDNEGLYLMSGEGGFVNQVVGDWPADLPASYTDVRWSPIGGKVAFVVRLRVEGSPDPEIFESRVYVVDADGSDMTLLQQKQVTSTDDNYSYDWSPDGAKVVIGNLESALTVVDVDGSDEKTLPALPTGTRAIDPEWSPDGSQIAYVASPADGLFLVDADGTNLHEGEIDGLDIFNVVWSPDSSQLAYRLYDSEESADFLNVIKADGSDAREVGTMAAAIAPNAVWTLDSQSLFFVGVTGSAPDLDYDIYKVNADGSALSNMTNDATPESNLLLSPDGSALLFLDWSNVTATVDFAFHVMAIDGSQTDEFAGPQDAETNSIGNLTWRPDGNVIGYTYQGDIFLLRVSPDSD